MMLVGPKCRINCGICATLFADAWEDAYGAVAYLTCKYASGQQSHGRLQGEGGTCVNYQHSASGVDSGSGGVLTRQISGVCSGATGYAHCFLGRQH